MFSMFSIWNVLSRMEFNWLTHPFTVQKITDGRAYFYFYKGQRIFKEARHGWHKVKSANYNILPDDDMASDPHPNPNFVKSQSQAAPRRISDFYKNVIDNLPTGDPFEEQGPTMKGSQ